MKKFLLHVAAFSTLLAGLLGIVTRFTDIRLRARDKGRMQVWQAMAQGRLNADVLLMGNSHTHVQLNPAIIAAAFPGRRVYNIGLDGYAFDMQLAQYHFYRRYNKAPRLIVLSVDYYEFKRSQWAVDKAQFLPYLYDTAIRAGMGRMDVSPALRYGYFTKYFGSANTVIAAITGSSPLTDDDARPIYAGFQPIPAHWDEAFYRKTLKETADFPLKKDSAVWASFAAFLKDCRKEGIAVCAVFAPYHSRYTARLKGAVAYRDGVRQAVKGKGLMLDFSVNGICADTALFYNSTHLNARGADVLSGMLADSLRVIYPAAFRQ